MLVDIWFEEGKTQHLCVLVFATQNVFKSFKNNIYFRKVNLKKMAENQRAKVFPKSKNGQKKCPIFKNGNTL
jgi:hypothetical protein